ncbi:MAG: T9SS type A sorting domain-containing protein [Bacteroidetes bacterium]|nr:T9SS type A sorting domain-containing protein [Bacteroidota bacterium]
MKKIIFLFFFFGTLNIFATHNRAGEILYKRIPPYTTYTYSITLIRYTDHGNGIADRCVDTLYFGDGQKGVAPRTNGGTGLCNDCSQCGEILINEPGYVLKENIYSITHTYSSPGTFVVSSSDPNRNGGIINIPNSVNQPFYVESVIVINGSLGINSSPVLTNLPADKGFVNTCYYHNPGAFDADGDSLSYQLIACKNASNQNIPGYFFPPFAPGGTFSISPTNGSLVWCTPQSQGEYNIAILVTEWRKINCTGPYLFMGSVMRDMQAVINNGTSAFISVSSIIDTCVVAGTVFNKTFTVTNNNQTNLTLIGSAANKSNLPLATLSSTTGINSFNSSVVWNTNCAHAQNNSHKIVYYAEQVNTPRQKIYSQFNLKVVPPAPVIVSVTTPTNHVVLTWKKVNGCNNIKGYYIYRKVGTNSWSHSSCETGVPSYAGFTLIGYKIPTDTVYDDGLFNPVANGSTGNYIVTTLMKDCLESFADTIKTVSFIVGLKENKLNENDLSVYPNPFLNNLQIDLQALTFEKVESTLYSIDGKRIKSQVDKNCKGYLTLNTVDLDAGIYFLYLKTEKGTLVKKVIRQ